MIYNNVTGYGQALFNAVSSVIPTFGRILVVMPNTDPNFQRVSEVFRNDPEGRVRVFTTLSAAYDEAIDGAYDVIALSANAAHAVTSMVTVSKNRIHFIGLDFRGGIGIGARTRVTMGVTTAATDIAVIKNTGVGNTFTGIKFDSSNTVDESLYAVAEAGEYTVYDRCEFYKSSDLNETAAAEVLNNGDSVQWLNCTFGSSANIIADNKIRPNMLLTATITGKKCRDNVISGCLFLVKAAGTEAVRIYGANATDVERMLLVKDSIFLSNTLGAATPAHAVGFGAAQTEGTVLLKNCTSVDHTVMAQAAVGIYVDGAVPTFATAGVSVAS
jgi:hypothetical protein